MGNMCFAKDTSVSSIYSAFCPLRIATLYADIDESINKKRKIETMCDYFMRPYYGYNLDVLCIQGIRNYRILKEIVHAFKQRVEKYNDDNRMGHSKSLYLEYYPDIECNIDENNQIWSTSESDDDIQYFDKLIVTRHSILQSADVQIGKIDDMITRKSHQIFASEKIKLQSLLGNNDSDEISSVYKYIQIVNLNVDGTYCSIYNIELESDSVGISNNKERRKQLHEIKKIVEWNRNTAQDISSRQFVYGDDTFVAANRDLHIVVGMFHINEIKNSSVNSEYNRMITCLEGTDTNKWVKHLRKDNTQDISNTRFTKNTFTIICSKNLYDSQDTNARSQKLFEGHKIVIIGSHVTKNHVDMNQFTNFPEDTLIMLYRPNIIPLKQSEYPTQRSGTTTYFMDQAAASLTGSQRSKSPDKVHMHTIKKEKIEITTV